MNWQEISAESHFQTAVAIRQALAGGDVENAAEGIQELIDALGRSEKRALKSQLIRLMKHIVKWQIQPERRSRSWIASIYNARDEIADIQEDTPSLTDAVVRDMWKKCLKSAIREAEGEMNKKTSVSELSWEAVFDETYQLNH